jgi:hypothetical protein
VGRKRLTIEDLVVKKKRPMHNFGPRHLTLVPVVLWTKDELIFITERYRLQFTFISRVYCSTRARISLVAKCLAAGSSALHTPPQSVQRIQTTTTACLFLLTCYELVASGSGDKTMGAPGCSLWRPRVLALTCFRARLFWQDGSSIFKEQSL